MTFGEIYPFYQPDELLSGEGPQRFQTMWDLAKPETFEVSKMITTFR